MTSVIPMRALQRYRRGHGFELHSGLNFFQALISQLLISCVYNSAAMIKHSQGVELGTTENKSRQC